MDRIIVIRKDREKAHVVGKILFVNEIWILCDESICNVHEHLFSFVMEALSSVHRIE